MKEAQMKLRTLATHGRMSHRPALGFLVAAAIVDLAKKPSLSIDPCHLPAGAAHTETSHATKGFGQYARNGKFAIVPANFEKRLN
jgi:hypothetical protein